MAFTFLDWHGQIRFPDCLQIWSAYRFVLIHMALTSSFFENRNPYAVVSVGVFFWSLANLRQSWILSSLGIMAALYSIVLAGSRNGVLTLVICLLFLLILTLKHIRKTRTAFILVTCCCNCSWHRLLHSPQPNRKPHQCKSQSLLNVKTYKDLESWICVSNIFRSALELGIAEPPILGSGTKTFGHEVFSKSSKLEQFNNAGIKLLSIHTTLLSPSGLKWAGWA